MVPNADLSDSTTSIHSTTMRDLPTFHPRKGDSSKYSIRAKQAFLGTRRFDTDRLIDAFPEYLADDTEITIRNRENLLSSNYQADNTYFIKVITPRHVKLHRLLTWWRNIIFRMSRLGTPFSNFDSPEEMAAYEYHAANHTYNAGGAIAHPYTYADVPGRSNAAAILYDYVPNAGKLTDDKKSLKAFEHITLTMRKLHNEGYTHTSIPFHIVQSVPTGEPYITDPVGRTQDTDKARLFGIGFDLASLLALYTPHIGALPALKVLEENYSDVELVAAYKTATPLQVTVPGTPPWVVSHLRSSINEYASGDAVDTYLEIVGDEYDTAHPVEPDDEDSSPYSTSEFIEAVMDNSEEEPEDKTHQPGGDDSDIRLRNRGTETPLTTTGNDTIDEPTTTLNSEKTRDNIETPPSPTEVDPDTTQESKPGTTQESSDPLNSGITWAGGTVTGSQQPLPENAHADTDQTTTSFTDRLRKLFS